MTKTVIRILLAVGCLALALTAQHIQIPQCGTLLNKQDCQDCCIATRQDQVKACQGLTSGTQECLQSAADTFDACMGACKSKQNETGPGEPNTNPQGQ